ncbi:MAG: efflux RND transporter permease subunit, partial [Thermodesulfobacteriota bacterium]
LENAAIFHKNLMPVSYVFGDLAGAIESPVYALAALNKKIDTLKGTAGQPVARLGLAHPENTENLIMKWDGEWHITLEVFRDLGLAFAAVLVLIYVLVVGWFESFEIPWVILVPIPLSLIGIIPAHGLFGAFFTATSMIGFIAGAGIIVRNSIILVDFIELKLKEGMNLEAAVEEAGVVRFRPILLTAAAVIVGSLVMLADPIFQGLAISLMAGSIAATLAGAIVMLANMAQWAAMFGGASRDDDEGGGSNIVGLILMAVLAPIAATLIQMAISRSREYLADAGGAKISGKPYGLAGALEKLSQASQTIPMEANPSTAHMFIVNPLTGRSLMNLFSTHPPIEERIARLRSMRPI